MLAPDWIDYEILCTGDGLKLERWKDVVLLRPDPQAIWSAQVDMKKVDCNARYVRSAKGGGEWQILKPFPAEWKINWRDYTFAIKPTGFKHTGLFPEQAVNWDLLSQVVSSQKKHLKVLNLFAYTGAVTAVLARQNCTVTHVDAAKGMVERAKINAGLNSIPNDRLRFIVDDCKKFVQREIKRGKKYDAIIMDPPSYGRGPTGEVWKMEDGIFDLVKLCADVLEDPTFVLINSYTTGLQPQVLDNILTLTMPKGSTKSYEVCLPTDEKIALPCGCSGLWRNNVR